MTKIDWDQILSACGTCCSNIWFLEMKTHEFETIVTKLGLKTRDSGDRLAWFVYEGKTVVRTKRSHGNKEQPGDKIRQQLKVNEEQLSGLISCSISHSDYVGILKSKGIIAPQSPPPSPPPGSTALPQNPTRSKTRKS